MMYFIDTNIFLRVFVKENLSTFQECRAFLEMVKMNRMHAVTSGLVLAEINWTLQSFYKFHKQMVTEALYSILDMNGLQIVDQYQHRDAVLLYEGKSVKFIDAQIASLPEVKAKEWTIVSYDRDFDKLDVIRKEPSKLIEKI